MKRLLKRIVLVMAMAVLFVSLVACVPSNAEKAKEKMANEGYNVTAIGSMAKLVFDGVEGGIYAVDNDGDMVIAVRFESVDDAKDAYNDWESLLSKLGQSGTALRDGKWVYSGMGDGVEDFAD